MTNDPSAEPQAGSVPSVPLPSPDRDSRSDPGAWPVRRALLVTLLVFGGGQLLGLGLVQGASGWLQGSTAMLDPISSEKLAIATQQWLVVSIQLIVTVIELWLVWVIAARFGDRRQALCLATPGYGPFDWVRAFAMVFGIKIVFSIAVVPLGKDGGIAKDMQPFLALARDTALWLCFLIAAVVGALVEELVFRAILSRSLEATGLGFLGGAAVASAIFAVGHLQYGFAGQAVVFVLGMTFSYLRARSSSIWPGVVTHALNNAVALLVMKAMASTVAA